MTSRRWEHWADHYRAAGLSVIDAGWTGMDAEVEQLRRDSTPIAAQTVERIVDHYDRIIRELPHPPIIMGHSFGRAFAQVLLDRELGAAGVAIGSAAVRGVKTLPFSTLRTGWLILPNPLNRRKAVAISLRQFHYRFTNRVSIDRSAPLHARYCVPGAGHFLFEGAAANLNLKSALKVDYQKRSASTAAVHRRRHRPRQPTVGEQVERQAP
jgi:pimeloyl-ACP methyl ester carboxylesterase